MFLRFTAVAWHTRGTTPVSMDCDRVSGAVGPPKLSDEQFAELCEMLRRTARRGLISAFPLVQPMVGNRYTTVDVTDI